MTMMVHQLVRLRGDEDWKKLGDDREAELDIVGDLPEDGSYGVVWMEYY